MSSKKRPCVVVGNWKMYKTIEEATHFIETLTPLAKSSQANVSVAVPFTAIYPAAQLTKKLGGKVSVGAQNMNDATEGAFTGEVASKMLLDAGAEFVILGHSERRHLFNESSALINKKVTRALSDHLPIILCVGETLEERESDQTETVVRTQLLESLEGVSESDFERIILAYEPVWAIGTGKVAQPDQAQAAHQFCRSLVAEKWGEKVADRLVILYGGSVNPDNAATLCNEPDVDGLLVGGASLSPSSFHQIITAVEEL